MTRSHDSFYILDPFLCRFIQMLYQQIGNCNRGTFRRPGLFTTCYCCYHQMVLVEYEQWGTSKRSTATSLFANRFGFLFCIDFAHSIGDAVRRVRLQLRALQLNH